MQRRLSLPLVYLCLFQLETYKNPRTSGYGISAAPQAPGLQRALARPEGATSPTGMHPTSRASAQLRSSGLILQKHLFCVERFCSVSARYFSDQSSLAVPILPQLPLKLSLGVAVQETLLTGHCKGSISRAVLPHFAPLALCAVEKN